MWNGGALSVAKPTTQELDFIPSMEHNMNIWNKSLFCAVHSTTSGTTVPSQSESEHMFTFVAATVFFASFLLAAATIVGMLALYRDKMLAALLCEPIPQQPRVYRLRVDRRRASPQGRSMAVRAAPSFAA